MLKTIGILMTVLAGLLTSYCLVKNSSKRLSDLGDLEEFFGYVANHIGHTRTPFNEIVSSFTSMNDSDLFLVCYDAKTLSLDLSERLSELHMTVFDGIEKIKTSSPDVAEKTAEMLCDIIREQKKKGDAEFEKKKSAYLTLPVCFTLLLLIFLL